MNKLLTCLMLIFAQIPDAHAQVLAQAPAATRAELQAAAALHPDLSALAENAVEVTAELAFAKEQLNRKLELAQHAFLEGSLDEARKHFQELSKMATNADWPVVQRRAIQYAMLRVVQLAASEPEIQNAYLERAAALDLDLKPDKSLIPPPVLTAFETTRKALIARAVTLRVRERFSGFEIMKVNGRSYRVAEKQSLKVLPGEYRIHLRSNSFAPITATMSAAKLYIYTPPRTPIVSGSCERPILNTATLASADIIVVFNEGCWLRHKKGVWSRFDSNPSAQAQADARFLRAPAVREDLEIPVPPSPSRPFYRKSWFWVSVVGLAAASFALSSKQNKDRESGGPVTPSSAEGF